MATTIITTAQGFDETYYLTAKAAQLTQSTGQTWTAAQVQAALTSAGLTAAQHYSLYGYAEGLSPNAYFNQSQYLASESAKSGMTADAFTLAWYNASGQTNIYTHYMQYGSFESGVNPSTGFDSAAYYAACATKYGMTADQVQTAIQSAGLNAISHYLLYGINDSLSYTPTAASVTAQTFTLTVNEDHFTGGDGNDVFNAYSVANAAGTLVNTLQSADVLVGGGGVDTLNATLASAAATTTTPSMTGIEVLNVKFAGAPAADNLDLANTTGATTLNVANSSASGTVSNLGSVDTISVKNQAQDLTLDKSTATTLNLTLDTFGTSSVTNKIDLGATTAAKATTAKLTMNNSYAVIDSTTADAIATLNVAATGTNTLSLVDSGNDITTATITGTGSLDMSATALTGDLTTFDASANSGGVKAAIASTKVVTVTGGSGGDYFNMAAHANGGTVALNAGNDTVMVGANIANYTSLNGGDGTDIIGISDGATFTTANLAKVTNFETLDIANGTGTYVMSRGTAVGITAAQVSANLSGATILSQAAAGFTLGVNTTVTQNLTVSLADDTGANDSVTFAMKGTSGLTGVTTVGGVENITVATTNTGTLATPSVATVTGLTDGDLDTIKTLTITGDSTVNFGTIAADKLEGLTKIDASAATGKVSIDMSTATPNAAIAYTGSAGVDTYVTATNAINGNTIYGGKANDSFTLTGSTGADIVSYKAATDVTTEVTGSKVTSGQTLETVTGFQTGTDKIDVSGLSFSGYQTGAIINKGAIVAVNGGSFDATIADFFADAGGDRGVAVANDGADTYVFIDANKDGNWDASTDIVVKATGLVAFSFADFSY